MRRVSIRRTALIAGAAMLFISGTAMAGGLRLGAPAPALGVRALDGQQLDLAALKGKVVVVNVWATWCAPCRAEMPMLDAFYRDHKAQGLVLVGLSADRTRDKGEVEKVMSAFSYPSGMLAQAKPDELGEPRALPLTFIIDRTGVVRAIFGGTGDQLTQARLEAAVRPLLTS